MKKDKLAKQSSISKQREYELSDMKHYLGLLVQVFPLLFYVQLHENSFVLQVHLISNEGDFSDFVN